MCHSSPRSAKSAHHAASASSGALLPSLATLPGLPLPFPHHIRQFIRPSPVVPVGMRNLRWRQRDCATGQARTSARGTTCKRRRKPRGCGTPSAPSCRRPYPSKQRALPSWRWSSWHSASESWRRTGCSTRYHPRAHILPPRTVPPAPHRASRPAPCLPLRLLPSLAPCDAWALTCAAVRHAREDARGRAKDGPPRARACGRGVAARGRAGGGALEDTGH